MNNQPSTRTKNTCTHHNTTRKTDAQELKLAPIDYRYQVPGIRNQAPCYLCREEGCALLSLGAARREEGETRTRNEEKHRPKKGERSDDEGQQREAQKWTDEKTTEAPERMVAPKDLKRWTKEKQKKWRMRQKEG